MPNETVETSSAIYSTLFSYNVRYVESNDLHIITLVAHLKEIAFCYYAYTQARICRALKKVNLYDLITLE